MKRVKSIVLASVLILFATVFSTPAMAWICTEMHLSCNYRYELILLRNEKDAYFNHLFKRCPLMFPCSNT